MNGKGIVEKLRDPTQLSYPLLGDLVEEADIKCPTCQCHVDCSLVPIMWPKLPVGIKFDPSDSELLQHLEDKSNLTNVVSSVLIKEFIPTIEEPGGICYTHPENLPGIKTDGSSRHFFHRISNAYGSGPRKRRKIDNKEHTACDDKNVRWHKTGRSKEVFDENGAKRGWKKILVLYTGSKKGGGKTDKAGWVMHQYHLGADEAEKDGQLVVCKIFYQSASKQIGKFEMDVSVMEHDASAVRIDPRTPKTDPPQPHLPSNSPCETEQYTSPFLLDQGEAESSRSNFCIKDEYEYRAWHPGLSQILEETAQPDEPSVTATQTFGSESGSGSGVRTFLDKAKATVSSTQVLKPGAGPNSRLGQRSWESGVQDMQSGSQEDLEAMLAQFYSTDADGNYN
ncbi:hypothetical protein QOZ80_4AG0313520 [Eleusine coracana subsp. coracana]|nr:hypothetical protein QOZ80_4AG0313520 [Eleusine coracana subsp. coracana]